MNEYQDDSKNNNTEPEKEQQEYTDKTDMHEDKPMEIIGPAKEVESAGRKRLKTLKDLAIGFGLSILYYALAMLSPGLIRPAPLAFLLTFLLTAGFVFLIVKFFRTNHRPAAIFMLVTVTPVIFIQILLGACLLTTQPY